MEGCEVMQYYLTFAFFTLGLEARCIDYIFPSSDVAPSSETTCIVAILPVITCGLIH